MTEAEQYWTELTQPVQRCLELAWDAHRAGSIPVGCVLVDDEGRIVAESRNRAFEQESPPGQIAGTYIAHAEINVLATLPPGEYGGHTLWTSLEPCFLCTSAAVHTHIGSVAYVARDPLMAGADRMPELNEWVAGRWPRRVGPLGGPADHFSSLLHLLWFIDRGRGGVVISAYEKHDPGLLAAAREAGAADLLSKATSVLGAIELVWPQISN